jgi:nucleotide-binding universal stress UspA family protein
MGMNARGSTEVIVATIGLSMGVLSQNLFTMIVAMAFITTTAMPPTLRWALHRLPMRKEERSRMAREEFEQRAFVPNLERILVVVDGSANGRFAARIAGLLAGTRGMPVTVLGIEDGIAGAPAKGSTEDKQEQPSKASEAVEVVTAAAEAVESRSETTPKIDVIRRQHAAPPEEAIAEEARRGYDLLVVGVDPTIGARGVFHENVSKLVRDFEGSIAVVAARGAHTKDPIASTMNILTPVTGNENSRRGAEVAVTLAKAAEAEAVALSVISRQARNKRQRRREADALADEVRLIAEHHATNVKTAVRVDVSAEDAILQSVERGKHNLIVMGVSRRPGDTLSFGDVATALLKDAKCSLLFISPQARAAAKSSAKGLQKAAAAV